MSDEQQAVAQLLLITPQDVPPLQLDERVLSGTLLDRLYDAANTTDPIVVLPLSDKELLFVATNIDLLDIEPSVLLSIPDVVYSMMFDAQAQNMHTIDYRDLRHEKDKKERKTSGPAVRRDPSFVELDHKAQEPKKSDADEADEVI